MLSETAAASADALDASVRLARLRHRMFARVEVTRIAQYQIVRPLGGGGMGLVFAAWDPSLDRLIAIKVLRDPWSTDAGANLRREAMALARLHHPGVVSVFEVGEHDGQTYLAMEYVEGRTLRSWVEAWRAAERRDYAALLDVFAQAAEGLAAAHAAGVVHRDVKPENIMVDEDGRARLMDFGLAGRQSRNVPTHDRSAPIDAGESMATRTHGIYGTPAYMAPEQFAGKGNEHSDQFALAACMYEAIYGERIRPSRMEPAALVADDPIELPAIVTVPRRIRAALNQALHIDPALRFASMQRFATALRHAAEPRSYGPAMMLAALLVGGLGSALALGSADQRCTGAPAQMAGVWDDARVESIESRSNERGGDLLWQQVRPRLNDYRDQWVDAHQQACEAARVREEISTAEMDQRMACLRNRRSHLSALADALDEGDPRALAHGVRATQALPDVAACSDADYVARGHFSADDPETAEAIEASVAKAELALLTSDLEGALSFSDTAVQTARIADARGLADALVVQGKARVSLHDPRAHDTLVDAYERARRSGRNEAATDAAIALASLCHRHPSRPDEALWWSRLADLEIVRGAQPKLDVRRDIDAAHALVAAGRREQAHARIEDAVEALAVAHGDDPVKRARPLRRIAGLYGSTGRPERGLTMARQARTALVDALGADHPELRHVEMALSGLSQNVGDIDAAIAHGQRALQLAEMTFGPDHIALARNLRELARATGESGRRQDALALADRALGLSHPRPMAVPMQATLEGLRSDIVGDFDPRAGLDAATRAYELARDSVGEQHQLTARYLARRAELLGAMGKFDEAIELNEKALADASVVLGSDHYDLIAIHGTLAATYQMSGRLEQATHHHQRAVALSERAYGDESFLLSGGLINLCGVLMVSERPNEALPHCRRAEAIVEAARGNDDRQWADLYNNLGGTVTQLGRRDEAAEYFRKARRAWQRVHGPGSYEESIVVNNLGDLAEQSGDLKTAEARFTEALQMRRAALGEGHPALANPQRNLDRVREKLR